MRAAGSRSRSFAKIDKGQKYVNLFSICVLVRGSNPRFRWQTSKVCTISPSTAAQDVIAHSTAGTSRLETLTRGFEQGIG